MKEGGSGLITSIQAARGIAALAVVLSHTGEILAWPTYLGYHIAGGYLRQGHAGVDFFFVLSGFIIFTVHADDLGRPQRLLRYLTNRALRIYPCLWLMLLITIALNGWSGIHLNHRMLTSMFLIPTHSPVGVNWTLQHEVIFYLIFSLAILHARVGATVIGLWFSACLVSNLARSSISWPWAPNDLVLDLFLSSYNLQFALGMAAAWLHRRRACPFGVSLIISGVCGFAIGAICEHDGAVALVGHGARMIFGISASLVVLGCATAESDKKLRAGRLLLFLGAASYSIYLTHLTVISVLASRLSHSDLPSLAVAGVIAISAVIGGAMLHLAFEAPVMRLVKRLRRPVPGYGSVDAVLADGTPA